MKISEVTYEQCLKQNENHFYMHYDCSDTLRKVNCESKFEEVKKLLIDKYGDVEVEIVLDNNEEPIVIKDPAFIKDKEEYYAAKAEWMRKNPECD